MALNEIRIHERKKVNQTNKQINKNKNKQTKSQPRNYTLDYPLSLGADGIYCQHKKLKCLLTNRTPIAIWYLLIISLFTRFTSL